MAVLSPVKEKIRLENYLMVNDTIICPYCNHQHEYLDSLELNDETNILTCECCDKYFITHVNDINCFSLSKINSLTT